MGAVGSLVEGGQTWAHRVRMLRQVLKIAFYLSLTVSSLVFFWGMSSKENTTYLKATYYFGKASICDSLDKKVSVDRKFWAQVSMENYGGKELLISPGRVIHRTRPLMDRFLKRARGELIFSSLLGMVSYFFVLLSFTVRGRLKQRKKHISGKKIVPWWLVALRLKLTANASKIKIGKLPLVNGSETQHILVSGGTGSGKSNCFHNILPQIRKQGQKAVVVDMTGDFVERYYRPGKDIILNPFDERSEIWNPWSECKTEFDYDSLAESFIPLSNCEKESYRRTAAKSLFSSLLQKTANDASTQSLMELLLKGSLSDLSAFAQGTKAAVHLDMGSKKTAASIRSVACSFVSSLKHLKEGESSFSIKDWLGKEDDDSWLFLSCDVPQRSTMRPLISAWISIAVQGLMQQEIDLSRRVWFVIDELPSLQKIESLDTLVTGGRKFGACGLFALQSPAQLNSVYGRDVAKLIIGNCVTKVVFLEQDPELAEKISKMFGTLETKQFQSGISYGSHELRDGVSLSEQSKREQVIPPSEILSLPKNTAFIRLPGKLPITKIKLSIIQDSPENHARPNSS